MLSFPGPTPRHRTVGVKVGNVTVGGGAPVVVQSMTNTDTADAEATAKQVAALARAVLWNRIVGIGRRLRRLFSKHR